MIRQQALAAENVSTMAAPTSLTQWNAVQQQSAEQVDVDALLARIQAGLRAQGIMYVSTLGGSPTKVADRN